MSDKKEMLQRSFTIDSGTDNIRKLDDGSIVVNMSVSSEEPYMRADFNGRYWEVLSHKNGAVDMTRLNNGAPLLWNHDRGLQIGVVEKSWVEDGKLRSQVRFSKNSELAREKAADVVDGILRNVSIGYVVKQWDSPKTRGKDANGVEYRTATSFQPMEISMVPVPADETVGVGRSVETPVDVDALAKEIDALLNAERGSVITSTSTYASTSESTTTCDDDGNPVASEYSNTSTSTSSTIYTPDTSDNVTADEPDGNKSAINSQDKLIINDTPPDAGNILERNTMADKETQTGAQKSESQKLRELAKSFGLPETKAFEWLDANRKAKDVYDELSATAEASHPGLSKKEMNELDVRGAIDGFTRGERSGLVYDMGMQSARDTNMMIRPDAFYLPLNVRMFTRTNAAYNGNASSILVTPQFLSFEDMLREQTVASKVGVQIVTGLHQELKLARQTTGSSVTWVSGETGSVNTSDIVPQMITWSPKSAVAAVPWTRTLAGLNQPYDIEQIARNDLALRAAMEFDKAIFIGTGASGQPTGLINDSAIPFSNSGSAGGFGYSRLWNQWTIQRQFNANGVGSYVISPKSWQAGATAIAFTGSFQPLIQGTPNAENGGGVVNGMGASVFNSNYLQNLTIAGAVKNPVLFGDFSKVLATQFYGALQFLLDPYTGADTSVIKLRMFLFMDTHAILPEALVRDLDAT